jgi:hypothetical protein
LAAAVGVQGQDGRPFVRNAWEFPRDGDDYWLSGFYGTHMDSQRELYFDFSTKLSVDLDVNLSNGSYYSVMFEM